MDSLGSTLQWLLALLWTILVFIWELFSSLPVISELPFVLRLLIFIGILCGGILAATRHQHRDY